MVVAFGLVAVFVFAFSTVIDCCAEPAREMVVSGLVGLDHAGARVVEGHDACGDRAGPRREPPTEMTTTGLPEAPWVEAVGV